MIAEIFEPFSSDTLLCKIHYQLAKIENGNASELFNSSFESLENMYKNMSLVAAMNDRIKLPFVEFVLSSPVGEKLNSEQFLDVAKEYLDRMGYQNSCFSIIQNTDKDNRHVHILATRIDFFGKRISDSFSKTKSYSIMRELERKFNLEVMEPGVDSKKISFGEHQKRQFYFDTALKKGLRSYSSKTELMAVLKGCANYNALQGQKSPLTNSEWKVILGEEAYDQVLTTLSEGGFLNTLYKDELLQILDQIYHSSKTVQEFRELLSEQGVYMRLVSSRGVSHYVYGIKELGFYVKDSALPLKYRWGKMDFDKQNMSPDEQKHFLYNAIFHTLNSTSSYQDFKEILFNIYHIDVTEHTNKKGIYGITFSIRDIESPISFSGSELSRRLTFTNIQAYYLPETVSASSLSSVTRYYSSSLVEGEILYMSGGFSDILDGGSKRRKGNDEDFFLQKKKKKRSRGLSLSN